MSKYILLTESGSDIPLELVKQYNIQVLPMHVIMGGVDYPDGSISVTEVYDYYNRTKKIPSTSATNPSEYKKMFLKLKEENLGCIIIHIGYSSKASCTYQNALIGSDGMEGIYHVDSLNVSGGEAVIILKVAEMIEKQPDIGAEELLSRIEGYVNSARVSFIPGNLEYLRAGGRLSNIAFLGASVLQLKPLIEIINGKLVATHKYRGAMKQVIEKYFNDFLDRFDMDKEQLCLLFSLGLEEQLKARMEEIAKGRGFKRIIWAQTGCVISTHSGPGAVGIAGFEI